MVWRKANRPQQYMGKPKEITIKAIKSKILRAKEPTIKGVKAKLKILAEKNI